MKKSLYIILLLVPCAYICHASQSTQEASLEQKEKQPAEQVVSQTSKAESKNKNYRDSNKRMGL